VLARQDGPTVLVGHSFSGMIVTEVGMHPNVSAQIGRSRVRGVGWDAFLTAFAVTDSKLAVALTVVWKNPPQIRSGRQCPVPL